MRNYKKCRADRTAPTETPVRNSVRTENVLISVHLSGVDFISVTIQTKTVKVTSEYSAKYKSYRRVKEEVIGKPIYNTYTFELSPTTAEELAKFRKAAIPTFVLKMNGNLYQATIPSDLHIRQFNLLGCFHQCSYGSTNHVCDHLSAAPDYDGGCEKVRRHSLCIESYPWITKGFETFATQDDLFFVANCEHFQITPPKK